MTDSTAPQNAPQARPKPRSGLGRGLNALMGDLAREEPVGGSKETSPGIRSLPVGSLTPHPGQPRRHFDEAALEELAQSIAQRGVLQPIVVRPHGTGYQIVAGERRWRAAQRARLHEVPVIVRAFDDTETLEVALVENIQRQDLNAIEEAEAYHRLIEDFGHTQEALGKLVNKSRSHIANLLRLLELPSPIQERVVTGTLTMGHARALIGAADVEALADQVVARGLSVRDTERLARAAKPAPRSHSSDGGGRDPDLAALEHQLADLLGLSVRVTYGAKGGTLVLSYSTLDQLDMVCQRLTGERI
ncbi:MULTISPECIES: ParB/RepB/Spo0J family partition protein [Sphingomonas]|jgi:ParB family chromosome partitioning protein|uniref:ParB/RepB/Spo0J family partition protein n=1 Tax=Sphingomonas echinoides TaxID=59803 RepID=A0ABU4PFA0_9SPHN|nr:ParB/RepB/Spo0J family partition protein [Sphingomonas echinoides]MDX5982893.1 ParB/RepB/Spo0J family partition protein [Sphingomonas echinoides]